MTQAHRCDNCDGIDPGTCLANPRRPAPAGDRLPDDVLALLLLRSYLSTACETARVVDAATIRHPENPDLPAWVETLHQRCPRTQQYTGVACYCTCHTA